MLPTLIATVLISVGLWYGLPGIVYGSKVCRHRGPDHLMHYPASIPWLRGKVNTASWAVRTGRICAGSGLVSGMLVLTIAWWPEDGVRPISPCLEMTPADKISELTGASITHGRAVDNDHRCEVEVRATEGHKLILNIEVDAPEALIGSSLENQRRELERRSMKIRALPTLGSDAILGLSPQHPERNAIILFTREASTVRVRLPEASPSQVKSWIRYFAQFKAQAP